MDGSEAEIERYLENGLSTRTHTVCTVVYYQTLYYFLV